MNSVYGGGQLQIKSNAAQGSETEETKKKSVCVCGGESGTQSQCGAIVAYKCIESNRVTKG